MDAVLQQPAHVRSLQLPDLGELGQAQPQDSRGDRPRRLFGRRGIHQRGGPQAGAGRRTLGQPVRRRHGVGRLHSPRRTTSAIVSRTTSNQLELRMLTVSTSFRHVFFPIFSNFFAFFSSSSYSCSSSIASPDRTSRRYGLTLPSFLNADLVRPKCVRAQ